MSETGTEIVIKGASVHIMFDPALYQKDSKDPKHHKHDSRRITRVQVEDENGKPLFDSGENGEGLRFTVRVSTR
ncbi:MAG TPA: hypothetical protein VLL54_18090 [Pyrinomonadaceae bacterium]|nr:hypothetical protein [Pyrinomonadaceae bacterium]